MENQFWTLQEFKSLKNNLGKIRKDCWTALLTFPGKVCKICGDSLINNPTENCDDGNEQS